MCKKYPLYYFGGYQAIYGKESSNQQEQSHWNKSLIILLIIKGLINEFKIYDAIHGKWVKTPIKKRDEKLFFLTFILSKKTVCT